MPEKLKDIHITISTAIVMVGVAISGYTVFATLDTRVAVLETKVTILERTVGRIDTNVAVIKDYLIKN